MSAYSGCCERDGGIRRSKRCSRTELVRVCGDVQMAGWGVSGGRAPSGGERQRSESSEGATELGFPGPTLGQMQSEAARRAGEPSGHGKEAASQGLGGHDLLAQTDARRPACQVVGDHLHRQPGAVGGEAARGEMVEPHAVLEVSDGVLDLGVAPMVGLQFQGLPPDRGRYGLKSGCDIAWEGAPPSGILVVRPPDAGDPRCAFPANAIRCKKRLKRIYLTSPSHN